MQLQRLSPIPVILFFLTLGAVGIVIGTSGGSAFSPGDLNGRSRRQTYLRGVSTHAEITSCSSCHAPVWSSDTMADRCLKCHVEIKQHVQSGRSYHGRISDVMKCRACHTEHQGPHVPLTDFTAFNHDYAEFKLDGGHASVDCQACHADNLFRGTSHACSSCHAEPQVHMGKFGSSCGQCHSTRGWKGASLAQLTKAGFDHDKTGFKLTGKHALTDCKACHTNDVFTGTSRSCVSCHAEPKVHLGKFGSACASCHSTSTWKGVVLSPTALTGFDHNKTAFKLSGKHTMTDCKSCHANNVFKGTSRSCVSCHAEPKVHLGKFGNACASCHSTSTWKGAVFTHKFPINHGAKEKRNNECSTCHTRSDYKVYTCYQCHKHEPDKIRKKHREVRFRPGTTLEQCAKCHANGKEKRRADANLEKLMNLVFHEATAQMQKQNR